MSRPGAAGARPIIIKKKKGGHAHGHHGGAWKIAYADFTTAMMAFFLMLWLVSNPEKASLRGLADYFAGSAPSPLSGGNGGQGTGGGGAGSVQGETGSPVSGAQITLTTPAESDGGRAADGAEARVADAAQRIRADELRLSLQPTADATGARDAVSVQARRDGIRIELMDRDRRPMFRAGTAEPFPYTRELLASIARQIAGSSQRVAIEGHSDSAGDPAGNWRLSGERALAAQSILLAAGLRPDRVQSVAARAGTEPAFPDDPTRAENRRITIILLTEAPATPRTVGFGG